MQAFVGKIFTALLWSGNFPLKISDCMVCYNTRVQSISPVFEHAWVRACVAYETQCVSKLITYTSFQIQILALEMSTKSLHGAHNLYTHPTHTHTHVQTRIFKHMWNQLYCHWTRTTSKCVHVYLRAWGYLVSTSYIFLLQAIVYGTLTCVHAVSYTHLTLPTIYSV